jgi:hypothetical protein
MMLIFLIREKEYFYTEIESERDNTTKNNYFITKKQTFMPDGILHLCYFYRILIDSNNS